MVNEYPSPCDPCKYKYVAFEDTCKDYMYFHELKVNIERPQIIKQKTRFELLKAQQ